MHRRGPGRLASRRGLLRTVGGGGLAAAGLAACGSPQPAPAQAPKGAGVVMIIRHAEKPAAQGSPHGVDIDGNQEEHSLSPAGWSRAGALTQLFGSVRHPPLAGLSRPAQLYASQGDTKSLRPLQTLSPLAARLGLYVITKYSRDDVPRLAAELRGRGGVSLIAWESDALPSIPPALGPVTPRPPSVWPDDRFDMIWVLNGTPDGWAFTQVPQLLLAGDRSEAIT